MKKKLFQTIFISVVTIFLIACTDKKEEAATLETKSEFDLSAAKTAIEAVNAEFGNFVSKSDSAGIANLYTNDAKLLGSNMPALSGKANIQSAFGGMLAMGIAGAKFTTTEVWGTEALVSEEGTYSLSDKSGKEIDKGKYIVLWKMEDGKWKLHRDIWNSDNPPAPTK
jgi:uncharacterized protein (TIGR02246 family)